MQPRTVEQLIAAKLICEVLIDGDRWQTCLFCDKFLTTDHLGTQKHINRDRDSQNNAIVPSAAYSAASSAASSAACPAPPPSTSQFDPCWQADAAHMLHLSWQTVGKKLTEIKEHRAAVDVLIGGVEEEWVKMAGYLATLNHRCWTQEVFTD